MPRKPSEAKSYLSTEGGGAAPAPIKRKRTTTRVKAGAKSQPAAEAATGSAIAAEPEYIPAALSNAVSLDPITERDEIARLAYLFWEARGGQGGSAEEDWLRAEQELLKKRATATC